MRTSLTKCKYYTDMRETVGQPLERLLSTTGKVWRFYPAFCSSYNASTLFF